MRTWPSASDADEQVLEHLARGPRRRGRRWPAMRAGEPAGRGDLVGRDARGVARLTLRRALPCCGALERSTTSRMARATSAFVARGTWRSPAAVTIVTSLSAASKPMSAREMSLTTIASRPLRVELVAAVGDRALAVLGGEADERLARRGGAAASAARTSVGALQRERRAVAPVLLDLALRPRRPGRKSATAAAISSTSAVGELAPRRRPAARRRSRRRRSATRGSRGERDVGGDDRDLRRRSAAASSASGEAHPPAGAVADEAHASIGSRVPPAVTSTRRPSQGRRRRRRRPPRRRPAARRGSARRPTPHSPLEASAPVPGSMHRHAALAQQREVGLRGRVLVHVVVHRRARRAAGSVAASAALVRRLSARPWASLAIVLARRRRDRGRRRRCGPARGG